MSGRVDSSEAETHLATRNALKLGGSLLLTGVIAIGMRLLLPRFLGPELFGTLSFADAFTAVFFIALSLGTDVYVRKNVSVRPAHASDFFGGTLVIRAGLSLVILAIMAITMSLTGRSRDVQILVGLFAVVQFLLSVNATLSALLHAKGTVGAMSVLAIVTKVAWAAGTLLAIVTGAPLWAFVLAYLLTEALETVVLHRLAVRHMGLAFRVDRRATWAMVVSSLPYYLNTVASTAYGKLGLTVLGLFALSSLEVGYYAAASAVAGLTLLATPLIEWVLMPTFARAAARSEGELFARIRAATEVIFAVAIPLGLLLSLSAPWVVGVAFGSEFAPAALALRILAPTFVVTYVAIVFAITLLMLERPWTLTLISVGGLGVNLALNVTLVGPCLARFGEGGGGVGAALAMLGTELFVTTAMMLLVGRRAFHRGGVVRLAKSLGVCVVVVAVDEASRALGPSRVLLDGLVYFALVWATGALPMTELVGLSRAALAGRGASTPRAAESAVATAGEGG